MTAVPGYADPHEGEAIDAECPYCHLPVYESDPRNMVSHPKGGRPRMYHRGCALTMRGHDLETDLAHTLKLLRELGYKIDLTLVRPVG